MVEDEKPRNYLYGISIEKYRASMANQYIPTNGWQKGNVHFQKLVDAGEIFDDYLPYVSEIKQPSLLLIGKYDPVCGQDQRGYFKQFQIGGTVVEFQNSGHFPRIEESQAYTDSIIKFLNTVL